MFEKAASTLQRIDARVSQVEKSIESLEGKLVELEDRSRRNNIIVFGVTEKADETHDDLMESVIEGVFRNMLGVPVSSAERIHRIGHNQPSKTRPVIVKLIDYREKINILKNCYKLKGKKVSVSEDFSAPTRQRRKKLWDSTSEIRRAGGKAHFVYDKIKVDGILFEWDDDQNKKIPVKRKPDGHTE